MVVHGRSWGRCWQGTEPPRGLTGRTQSRTLVQPAPMHASMHAPSKHPQTPIHSHCQWELPTLGTQPPGDGVSLPSALLPYYRLCSSEHLVLKLSHWAAVIHEPWSLKNCPWCEITVPVIFLWRDLYNLWRDKSWRILKPQNPKVFSASVAEAQSIHCDDTFQPKGSCCITAVPQAVESFSPTSVPYLHSCSWG